MKTLIDRLAETIRWWLLKIILTSFEKCNNLFTLIQNVIKNNLFIYDIIISIELQRMLKDIVSLFIDFYILFTSMNGFKPVWDSPKQ